ncbi:MAG: DUF6600 domain-containing protein [Ignavibacteriaceae bacterium]|nr:DUF6600 domain-containing protein [Ignavibacteriaceae bacterium]
MKRIIILAVVLFVAVTFNAEAKRHNHGVGGYFYTQLAPYGSWIEVDYGVVVWRPTIIRTNWTPYNVGRWVWTYDGWYWDSYEPFGHVTYHYGRWYYDDYYGWLWYPDYEWAPAWVEWRYDNNYIGWAPLHPYATFSISIGIFWSNTYYSPYHHWNYVNYNYFCDPYVYNYYVEPNYKYRIHGGTKYRHDYGYRNGRVQNRGIDVKYISDRSGQKIKQRDLTRVRDSKDLNRDSFGSRDDIRTLDLKRDELVKNDLGRMEIKRENRKTALELDKVQIGRRENVTTEKREDNSRDRNLDVRKNDQTRNDVKTGVDKIFEQKRTETKRNSDINVNRNNDNIETRKRETSKISTQNENVRKTNDLNTRNKNQVKEQSTQVKRENTRVTNNDQVKRNEVKEQSRVKTNGSVELNKKRQEQNTQVKRENTRVTNNNQVKKNEVKEQSRSNNQQNRTSETRVNTDRTKEKDNSRERSRR